MMNKTVLITGASSGIGLASAKLFVNQGWNVIATLRKPAEILKGEGPGALFVTRLDVTDRASIDAAVAAGIARFGRIDVLINNAGYGQYGVFEAIPREKIQEQFAVNVFGVMDVTRALLPHFRKNKSGLIVNVSSGAGLFTLPLASAYCASKFALEGFSEALSYELASQNIRVKLVEPHGGVNQTRFNARADAETPPNGALADYNEFVKRTTAAFAAMTAARSIDAADVAKVIFEAASDGTERLRYLAGNDTRGFVRAKQEFVEEDYVNFMRAKFLGQPWP